MIFWLLIWVLHWIIFWWAWVVSVWIEPLSDCTVYSLYTSDGRSLSDQQLNQAMITAKPSTKPCGFQPLPARFLSSARDDWLSDWAITEVRFELQCQLLANKPTLKIQRISDSTHLMGNHWVISNWIGLWSQQNYWQKLCGFQPLPARFLLRGMIACLIEPLLRSGLNWITKY